jgi:hypothetical protein
MISEVEAGCFPYFSSSFLLVVALESLRIVSLFLSESCDPAIAPKLHTAVKVVIITVDMSLFISSSYREWGGKQILALLKDVLLIKNT